MDPLTILGFVTKGLTVVEAVWENRDLALQAINSIKNIVSKDDPTAAEIEETEMELDALLEEFNAPLPPDDS